MAISTEGVRGILLYEYLNGVKVTEALGKLRKAFGDDIIGQSTCYDWYKKFDTGVRDLSDAPRSGRPSTVEDAALQHVLSTKPDATLRELAEELQTSHTTIHTRLRKLGYASKLCKWVPHALSDRNRMQRYSVAVALRERERRECFLHRLVTGDEKWVTYVNVTRKRAWTQPGQPPRKVAKPPLHGRKVMLSCWWDCRGVIHYELLPRNTTITAVSYIQQLDRLHAALQEKRPALLNRHGVVFHQDNARPHVALRTQQKLHELEWEILPHPAYSPDIAPSDFHLFRSLSTFLAEKTFANDDDVKRCLDDFFRTRSPEFYRNGIFQLVERWNKVISSNGDYLDD